MKEGEMEKKQSVPQDILKYVEEACKEVNTDGSSQINPKFLEVFKSNLETAINEAYFGEKKEDGQEPISELCKEKLEYETVVTSVIGKRQLGTKLCIEMLNKTLAIEKKTMEVLEVASGAVVYNGSPVRQLPPNKREERRFGTRKAIEHMKESTKLVDQLEDKLQELTKAAIVFKECNDCEFIR